MLKVFAGGIRCKDIIFTFLLLLHFGSVLKLRSVKQLQTLQIGTYLHFTEETVPVGFLGKKI